MHRFDSADRPAGIGAGTSFPADGARSSGAQMSLDDLGTPLSEVTFVIVDLETTGGAPADAGITEIGAVRVRGGEVLGEFSTLVDPGHDVPAFIASLTGITTGMLIGAPSVGAATASFWEFARGAVIVAHNAPYDLGFLRAAASLADHPWPAPKVIDTARLARRLLARDETRNVKLATLAQFFGSPTTPIHRALDDARATVAVLHGLFERAGAHGVRTLEDLLAFTGRTHEVQRRKRGLADHLPTAPGVYVFRDAQGAPLYVGTSRCIKDRVRSYFTASEPRTRMREMLHIATEVTPIVCATALEAHIREIRLIAEHSPPYNRRSRNPDRAQWLALRDGTQPRLSITGRLSTLHRRAIGPYPNRAAATQAALALQSMLVDPAAHLGRDPLSPLTPEAADMIDLVMRGDARALLAAVDARMQPHIDTGRFERAQEWRDRLEAALLGIERAQMLAAMVKAGRISAGRLEGRHWHLHIVDEGRLVAAGVVEPGRDPREVLSALEATAEVCPAAPRDPIPRPMGLAEESRLLWSWLTEPGTRLIQVDHPLALPLHSGGQTLTTVRTARGGLDRLHADRWRGRGVSR